MHGARIMPDEQVIQSLIGQRVRVEFNDCCVEGTLVGVVLGLEYEEGEAQGVIFESGMRIAPMWGSWSIEPMQESC